MNEMINNIGERMVSKVRVTNIYRKEWDEDERSFSECRPQNRYDYELRGMTQILDAMDIDHDFEWDNESITITAVIIMGRRFAV